jgi:hypothetical protein
MGVTERDTSDAYCTTIRPVASSLLKYLRREAVRDSDYDGLHQARPDKGSFATAE